jgi:hypothetical protein
MVKNTKNYNLSKNLKGDYTDYFNKIIGGDMAKKIQRTKKLLDLFDATNNGVIYTQKKTHKGGAIDKDGMDGADKTALNTCAIFGYSDKVLDICKTPTVVNDFKLLRNTISIMDKEYSTAKKYIYCNFNIDSKCDKVDKKRNIDDIILEYYFKNKKLPDNTKYGTYSISYDLILGPNLKHYIDTYTQPHDINDINILNHDEHGRYKISELKDVGNRPKSVTNQEGESVTKQDFSHSGYNKEIVQAYEKNYIDNIKNLPKFMEKQYEFMHKMSITYKIIINDYTKKSCFHFYSAYASKMISEENLKTYIMNQDGEWVKTYDTTYADKYNVSPVKFGFGDSFFKQIFDVIGKHRFNAAIIKDILKTNTTLLEKYGNGVTNIDQYWQFLEDNKIDRAEPNSLSIFSDLTPPEWDKVMRQFINDIDNIIAGAPPCETDIYCYRAVGFDYIKLHEMDDTLITGGPNIYRINEGTYINTRIGSLSLNYGSSERYLGIDETTGKKTGTMYRAVINTGVNVLYIPSLSYASDEFEILHASYAIFLDKHDNYKCYNNKKNKYGILSYEQDQFNSALVGLAGYARHINNKTFDKIGDAVKNLLTDIQKDIQTERTSSIKNLYHKHFDDLKIIAKTNQNIKTIIEEAKEKVLEYKNDNPLTNKSVDFDIKNFEKYLIEPEASGSKIGGKRSSKK